MLARELSKYVAMLEQEQRRLNKVLHRIAVAVPEAIQEVNPGEDSESGASGAGPGDDEAIAAREGAALREVNEALRLIRESPQEYGKCVRCGQAIAPTRLAILPATRFCGKHAG